MYTNIVKDVLNNSSKLLPDKTFLRLKYRYSTGKKLNLSSPIAFNEKLQWLKLYDRRPEYTNYVDKFNVRSYIKGTIGEEYLIPIHDVYESVDEIDWDKLPSSFVLKCTHGSGSNIICKDKKKLNIEEAKYKLEKWMKRNWFWYGREWPYKNVKPKIVCEKFMVDESGKELKDYKFFCFNGEPKIIQVDYNRFNGHKRNLYDTEWNYIPASIKYPTDENTIIKKPESLEKMISLARVLSKGYPHVRIDFYLINEKIYFGEMTFHHGSGFEKFEPESLGEKMGNWINIPKG
ncbi:ATP-grasp fold amidoligase family protein [Bacillus sp. Marseille-P3661]|uniref:ATP-grasp fold amidoligase family protein n=1 Tax=Bacillus sp. Marseille-P3661 TaxID=1936234 RepID=UPI000C819340|nr:ATP-grasp fold amidoligase family protein [Bacillus sp. Marseille-P3661]